TSSTHRSADRHLGKHPDRHTPFPAQTYQCQQLQRAGPAKPTKSAAHRRHPSIPRLRSVSAVTRNAVSAAVSGTGDTSSLRNRRSTPKTAERPRGTTDARSWHTDCNRAARGEAVSASVTSTTTWRSD